MNALLLYIMDAEHQNAADMHYQQQNYGGLTGLQEHQQDSTLGQQQQSPAGEQIGIYMYSTGCLAPPSPNAYFSSSDFQNSF